MRYHDFMPSALQLDKFQTFMLSKISQDPILHFTFWISVYTYNLVGNTAVQSVLLHRSPLRLWTQHEAKMYFEFYYKCCYFLSGMVKTVENVC